jgi:thiamine biosynthesis protein ThiS
MPDPILIHVNGEAQRTPEGTTITALLARLGLNVGRVAVEYNLKILPKSQWDQTQIAPGDRLEIVQFVGGG